MPSKEFAYDSLPYSNNVFAQTHPDVLCCSARLFGLDAPPVENSRILEIGCGNGMNLISHAFTLPEAEFIGIDLAKNHIDYAKKSVRELGLKNIDFRQIDLLDVSAEDFGRFEYIFAHGFFSWVPEAVREKTLSIFRELLAEPGVGYLSYNTYPGWHYRRMVSEIGKIHTRNLPEPLEKISEARDFIKFLGEQTGQKDVYKFILQNETFNWQEKEPVAIFHDNLSEINQPFYFFEFAEMLDRFEFQFLSEAELFSMFPHNLSPEAKKLVEGVEDHVWKQQYMDFLRGRNFRQTLFCRKNFRLDAQPRAEALDELFVASGLKTESANPQLFNPQPEKFVGLKEGRIEIDHPLTKTALFNLEKIWGDSVSFTDLLDASRRDLEKNGVSQENADKQMQITRAIFLQLILQTDLIEIHSYKPKVFTKVTDQPKINELARWQLTKGDLITASYERIIKVEDRLIRTLLENLDGEKSLAEVRRTLRDSIESSEDFENKREILENLPRAAGAHLAKFARAGLFIG